MFDGRFIFFFQILYEKNRISPKLQDLFRTGVATAVKEGLQAESEFWSSSKTLLKLSESNYFETSEFPPELKEFIGVPSKLFFSAQTIFKIEDF